MVVRFGHEGRFLGEQITCTLFHNWDNWRGCGTPSKAPRPLGRSRRCLPGEALLKQFLQAGCRLVLAAQNEELRVAAKPCTQSGQLTADLTVALRCAALEPQVRL